MSTHPSISDGSGISFQVTGSQPEVQQPDTGEISGRDITNNPPPLAGGIRNHEGLQDEIQITLHNVGTQDGAAAPKLNTRQVDDLSIEVQRVENDQANGLPNITFEAVPQNQNDLPPGLQPGLQPPAPQPGPGLQPPGAQPGAQPNASNPPKVKNLTEDFRKRHGAAETKDKKPTEESAHFKLFKAQMDVIEKVNSWIESHIRPSRPAV